MNARARLVAGFLPVLLATGACGPGPEDAQSGIAIRNVTVIDAVSGERPGQTVLIDGDRIVLVGPADSIYFTAAEQIDGTGKFLIPGLWDMHVHLTYDDRFTATMPEMFIRYGITSVRDTGGLMEKMAPVVERMRAQGAVAPRVFFSGPLLDGATVVYDGIDAPEIGVPNPEAPTARSRVAELKSQGVDFIKIYEMVSPEVFAALVEAAGTYGLPIASHVPLSMRASTAGPHVNSMEHLRNVELDCAANSDELLETRRQQLSAGEESSGMKLRTFLHSLQRREAIAAFDEAQCAEVLGTLRNTIQVPTARLNAFSMFPVFDRDDWPVALAEIPQAVQDEWSGPSPSPWVSRDPAQRDLTVARYTLDMIARMHEAGVPVGAGTDTPIALAIPGYSLHNELEVLVAAGLTPLDALGAATVQPAKFFALEDEMGAIAPGMRADLVLLRANPLTDIRNTRKIDRVIARGRLMPVH
ncbi:MAG: amidohydrolase family protein [Gammaproteobacteria bacterium]|nr:amidohydrolase family protein [Gammaproteobacteria bacterium]